MTNNILSKEYVSSAPLTVPNIISSVSFVDENTGLSKFEEQFKEKYEVDFSTIIKLLKRQHPEILL